MQTRTRKVLLVDDDQDYLQSLKSLLRQCGFRTCSARNGAWALLAVHAERPDLIVLDAEMPVMNGYQMLEVLLNDPGAHRPPVILLTPRSDTNESIRGWFCGAEACFPRGASLTDLAGMIERTLRSRPEVGLSPVL